jgi:hypothetical protein
MFAIPLVIDNYKNDKWLQQVKKDLTTTSGQPETGKTA